MPLKTALLLFALLGVFVFLPMHMSSLPPNKQMKHHNGVTQQRGVEQKWVGVGRWREKGGKKTGRREMER